MSYGVKDVVFLDIRDTWENKDKQVKDSILIPFNKLPFELESTLSNKNMPLFVFCTTGTRCKVAKDYMADNGYDNIIGIGTVEDAERMRRDLENS